MSAARSIVVLFVAVLLPVPAAGGGPVDYLRDVKPLLKARCYACHGGLQQKAKLRLDTAAALRAGGRNGPAIVPGKSAASLLIERITDTEKRMPPEGTGAALTTDQVRILRTWIDQGATGPAVETPEPDPRAHWAFRPVVRPRGRNAIDAFFPTAATATVSKNGWLRRVTIDLVGLPPTRAELQAFLADDSPAAYERVVDRLLASPRYGERWGRHWMDVWRYSDWYGRRQVPDVWNSAPQVWRWRDWIVRSLNADKGYDRMVVEMLAGDELAPDDPEARTATGYIVRNWYALNSNQWMRDLVEHTGKAFLGLTFNCAHCHDHKYDPITQEDYFRFRAFFEPLGVRQEKYAGEDPGPFQKYSYSVVRKVVKTGLVCAFDETPDAKTYLYQRGDERDRIPGRAPVEPGMPAFLGGDRLHVRPLGKSTGRRLALARWIADPQNPLTARVAANHIWARHFGRPLVESVYDFGRNGKLPAQPELLDWLASELVASGWRMMRLHRLIVLSDHYRSSRLAPRRMEAEVVRDSLLHLAGLLDTRLGGPPVEQQSELASRRRSLYFTIHPEAGGHMEFLELFDAPNPCDCYRRTESLVPQQALALTNSELVTQVSKVLSTENSVLSTRSEREFVRAAFQHLLSRTAKPDEEAACLAFLRKQAALHPTDGARRARESLLRVLFNHEDFLTIR